MVPPSARFDFAVAAVALTGAMRWFYWTRNRSLDGTFQRIVTAAGILVVTISLVLLLLRFGYVRAAFHSGGGRGGFVADVGPFWRVLPAIGAEVASTIVLLLVLVRSERR